MARLTGHGRVSEGDSSGLAADLTLAQLMLPQDANPHGNVHGGTLMKLADTAGGICTIRYCRSLTVTVVMDSLTFDEPVYVGDLVEIHARVTWTGRTSLETEVRIQAENVITGQVRQVSSAYFVYVAIDQAGKPVPVPPFLPSTEDQRRRWKAAEKRHKLRLQRPERSAG